MGGQSAPLSHFVLDDFWRNDERSLPCTGLLAGARLQQAVFILKNAGYTWAQDPAPSVAGRGLTSPVGIVVTELSLLVPENDSLRVAAAVYIAEQMQVLGIPVNVQQTDSDTLLYAVYGSRDYDMALLGWRLSVSPSYLCEWFLPGEANPFAYRESRLVSGCDAFGQTSDLEKVRTVVYEIQSILMDDLPLIPLYINFRTDAYRNLYFSFESIWDGLSGLYGASSLAVPYP